MEKIMLIASTGGHLTEILKLQDFYINKDYIIITEKDKITMNLKEKYNIDYLLYGSRFYPIKYIFISLANFFKTIRLFFKYKPTHIYTTGAHTAVMMCYLGKLFHKKIIFIEVFDRITSPTLSGKLIYPIANLFIVQHKELLPIYKKAKYIGGIY